MTILLQSSISMWIIFTCCLTNRNETSTPADSLKSPCNPWSKLRFPRLHGVKGDCQNVSNSFFWCAFVRIWMWLKWMRQVYWMICWCCPMRPPYVLDVVPKMIVQFVVTVSSCMPCMLFCVEFSEWDTFGIWIVYFGVCPELSIYRCLDSICNSVSVCDLWHYMPFVYIFGIPKSNSSLVKSSSQEVHFGGTMLVFANFDFDFLPLYPVSLSKSRGLRLIWCWIFQLRQSRALYFPFACVCRVCCPHPVYPVYPVLNVEMIKNKCLIHLSELKIPPNVTLWKIQNIKKVAKKCKNIVYNTNQFPCGHPPEY